MGQAPRKNADRMAMRVNYVLTPQRGESFKEREERRLGL
jgi:hypothetical protein